MKKLLTIISSLSMITPIASNLVSCNFGDNTPGGGNHSGGGGGNDADALPKGAADIHWMNWDSFDYVEQNYDDHDLKWWTQAEKGYESLQQPFTDDLPSLDEGLDVYTQAWASPFVWSELIPHGYYQCEIAHAKLMINILNHQDVFQDDIQTMKYDEYNVKTWWLNASDIEEHSDDKAEYKQKWDTETKWYNDVYSNVKDFVETIFNVNDFDSNFSARTGTREQNYWFSKKALDDWTTQSLEDARKEQGFDISGDHLRDIEKGISKWYLSTGNFDQNYLSFIEGYADLNSWFNK